MKTWPRWKYIATNVQFESIFIWTLLALRESNDLNIEFFKTWISSSEFKKIVRSDWSNETKKVLDRVISVKKALLWVDIERIKNSLLAQYS
jgi:hypothetical protein